MSEAVPHAVGVILEPLVWDAKELSANVDVVSHRQEGQRTEGGGIFNLRTSSAGIQTRITCFHAGMLIHYTIEGLPHRNRQCSPFLGVYWLKFECQVSSMTKGIAEERAQRTMTSEGLTQPTIRFCSKEPKAREIVDGTSSTP